MQKAVSELEAIAGQTVRADARKVIEALLSPLIACLISCASASYLYSFERQGGQLLFEVNDECGWLSDLLLWRDHIVWHETEHRDSYNECVKSGGRLQNKVSELEAVAGQTVRADALEVIEAMFDILFYAGEAGLPPALTPDGMWHRRQMDGWSNISHMTEGHGGQWGCP